LDQQRLRMAARNIYMTAEDIYLTAKDIYMTASQSTSFQVINIISLTLNQSDLFGGFPDNRELIIYNFCNLFIFWGLLAQN